MKMIATFVIVGILAGCGVDGAPIAPTKNSIETFGPLAVR